MSVIGGVKPHPAMQLSSILNRSQSATMPMDRTFQSEGFGEGDKVTRTFTSYGSMRPSNAFSSVTRNQYFAFECGMDMSNLPYSWNDVSVDNKKAGSFHFAEGEKVDLSHLAAMNNYQLMLPSTRFREAMKIKAGKERYAKAKEANRLESKQRKVVAAHYARGLVGVDGPMYPNTEYWKEDRERFLHSEKYKADHSDRYSKRRDYLKEKWSTNDTFHNLHWATNSYELPHRSAAIPIQRLGMDDERNRPDTKARIFPQNMGPTFDPIRAKVLKHHQDRAKRHNIIAPDVDNHIEGIRSFTENKECGGLHPSVTMKF